MKSISKIDKIKMILGAFALYGGGGGVIAASFQTPSIWFDETFSNMVEVSDLSWTDDAGKWTKGSADDTSSIGEDLDGRYIDVNTGDVGFCMDVSTGNDGCLRFEPTAKYRKSSLTVIEAKISFTAYRDGKEVDVAPQSNSPAALGMKRGDDGAFKFIVWRSTRDNSVIKGRWLQMEAGGLEPEEGVPYSVRIEIDFTCVPTRVRYSVDGKVLSTSYGDEWIVVRNGYLEPTLNERLVKYATTVCFIGRGRVRDLSATRAERSAERATVSIATISRPVPGAVVSASLDKTAAGTSGDFKCRWYLADASGLEVEDKGESDSFSYVLSASDFGHWVCAEVSDDSGYVGTARMWFSDLPVVQMEVEPALGYAVTTDETASKGVVYYWVDGDTDDFYALETVAGEDLSPYREEHGDLYVVSSTVKWPSSAKETHSGTISIMGNAEYNEQYSGAFTIHVRGNSTSTQDKKPYKIKLDKKADLFGLGGGVKNKHWVLLANVFDESLMRNKLSYDLSAKFGAPVAMKSEWVDVVMNGEYIGNYQICQHIRVAEDRVPVYSWGDAVEKIAEKALEANPALTSKDQTRIEDLLETNCSWMSSGKFSYLGTNYTVKAKGSAGVDENGDVTVVWKKFTNDISGGYVFELDSKKFIGVNPAPSRSLVQVTKDLSSLRSLDFYLSLNTPEFGFTDANVSNYVCSLWSEIGSAWLSGTGYGDGGRHYSELVDFDSMVSYWLAQYVPGNYDAFAFSRYAYKEQGGKVVFAPVWDFDYGLGSLQVRSGVATNASGHVVYAQAKPEDWVLPSRFANFMCFWAADPYFIYRLRERYLACRADMDEIVRDGGLIDQYEAKLTNSARANDLRWNNRIGFFGNGFEPGDAEALKTFLTRRFAWLDERFATLDSALADVTKIVYSSKMRYERNMGVTASFTVQSDPVVAHVSMPNANAASVDTYVNGLLHSSAEVTGTTADIYFARRDFVDGNEKLVEFMFKSPSGAVLYRNIALVTVDGLINDSEKPVGYMDGSTAVLTNVTGIVEIPNAATAVRSAIVSNAVIVTSLGKDMINIYATNGNGDMTAVDITPAFNFDDAVLGRYALSLDPEGVVDGVKVRPELAGGTGESQPFSVDDDVILDVSTIPGLWYAVKYGDDLVEGRIGGSTEITEGAQATGKETRISAPRCEGGTGFYQILVAPSKAGLAR